MGEIILNIGIIGVLTTVCFAPIGLAANLWEMRKLEKIIFTICCVIFSSSAIITIIGVLLKIK